MEFLLIAYDGTDPDAPNRRQAARAAHLENAKRLKAQGKLHLGGAILDDAGNMIGSCMVFEFDTRKEFDACLENDPYIKGKVWKTIEVKPFRRAKVQ